MILKTSYNMKPPISARLIRGHPLAKGLVACWLLNEGSGGQVFDLSGNGNHGTFSTTPPTWVSGKFGSASNFPANAGANGQWVSLGSNWDIQPFTYVVWVKVTAFHDTDNYIIGIASERSRIAISSSTSINGRVYAGGWKTITGSYVEGEWFQTALSVPASGGTVRFYVNGAETGTPAVVGAMVYNGGVLRLGARVAADDEHKLNGLIDHAMIYNRALSASEIALLYREPFCMFDHPMDSLFAIGAAPPEIQALYMDLSTQLWTIKHSTGLFTKL